jgi:hypothetical protein
MMKPCALAGVGHVRTKKKPRAKMGRQKMSKNKNKRGKHTKTNNKNTHTSFSCCCCGWEEAGKIIKITCSFLCLEHPTPLVKWVGCIKGGSRDREEEVWIILPRRRFDGLIQLLEFAERRLTGLTRPSEIRLARRRH